MRVPRYEPTTIAHETPQNARGDGVLECSLEHGSKFTSSAQKYSRTATQSGGSAHAARIRSSPLVLGKQRVEGVVDGANPDEFTGSALQRFGRVDVCLRHDALPEAHLRGFPNPQPSLGDAAHFAGEADLAEDRRGLRDRSIPHA